MELREAINNVFLKFQSGNDIPIERATMTIEEWKPIRKYLLEKLTIDDESEQRWKAVPRHPNGIQFK